MILQKENKVLRQKAKPVADPKYAPIKTLIEKMADAMFAEPDGIGIAAPQIGESFQVFLVAKDALALASSVKNQQKRKRDFFLFINPKIKKFSKKQTRDVEGCLSVRGFYGEVSRPEKLTIEFLDENGNKISRGASGLFARVIQHEMDHLNGVLFIDKAKNIKRFPQNPKDEI